jgi:hypothetical protein
MAKRIVSGKLFNQSWIEFDEEISSLVSSSELNTLFTVSDN